MALQKATSKPIAFWPEVRPNGMLSKAMTDHSTVTVVQIARVKEAPSLAVRCISDAGTLVLTPACCFLGGAPHVVRAPEQWRWLVRDAIARAPVRAGQRAGPSLGADPPRQRAPV